MSLLKSFKVNDHITNRVPGLLNHSNCLQVLIQTERLLRYHAANFLPPFRAKARQKAQVPTSCLRLHLIYLFRMTRSGGGCAVWSSASVCCRPFLWTKKTFFPPFCRGRGVSGRQVLWCARVSAGIAN